jgi:hypothetical protein
MKKRAVGLCIVVCMIVLSVGGHAEDEHRGTTRQGIYGCKTRAAMVEMHAAFQSMQSDRSRELVQAGTCWDVAAGREAKILQDGEWGSPIQVSIDGRQLWIMQYMLRYGPKKENENDVCKVLFAAGVGAKCGWAPRKAIVATLKKVGEFAVKELEISSDRLLDLQTLHIPAGRKFAETHTCQHPYVILMKRDYGRYFSTGKKE